MIKTPTLSSFSLARTLRFVALVTAGIATMSTLVAAPPANDDFANAFVISGPSPFTHSMSTAEATSGPEPLGCFETSHTVWYSYTPSKSGPFSVDTFGSDYDTILEVYYFGSPEEFYLGGCSDNDGDGAQSRLSLWGYEGETLYFMAGSGNGSPGGNLVLNLVQATPPTVTVTVVEPLQVKPSDGSVGITLRIESSEPITLTYASASVMQPNGRGVIAGSEFLMPWQTGTSIEVVFPPIRDSRNAREHGTGFTGGPARVHAAVGYSFGSAGFGDGAYFDKDVQLRGGSGKP